jgi:hypothetical protein
MNLKKRIISKNLINKITHLAPIREKAFFTIMRQSGLKPKTIARLGIMNLEQSAIIPRKIGIRDELEQNKTNKPPAFIGEEANRYLKQYLATRKDLTEDSLLFATKNNENKEISTKNVSRAFREILKKIEKKASKYNQTIKPNFSLISLTDFYLANTKDYKKEIDNNPHKDDEYYRKLYEEKALPFLEIESQIIIETITKKRQYRNAIEKRDCQIKEMTQTIARDNEFISSILTLLYDNKGDPETGQNEVIGDNFIKLWKKVSNKQTENLKDVWQSHFKIKLIPYIDIVEELTKTLKRIKKPYNELERQTAETRKNSENKVYKK